MYRRCDHQTGHMRRSQPPASTPRGATLTAGFAFLEMPELLVVSVAAASRKALLGPRRR